MFYALFFTLPSTGTTLPLFEIKLCLVACQVREPEMFSLHRQHAELQSFYDVLVNFTNS